MTSLILSLLSCDQHNASSYSQIVLTWLLNDVVLIHSSIFGRGGDLLPNYFKVEQLLKVAFLHLKTLITPPVIG